MIGSLIGDIAGSTYEFLENKDSTVELFPPGSSFTDDTVMSVATAHAILSGVSYRDAYLDFGTRYPDPMGAYGMRFAQWLRSGGEPYGSWGNGSAMRAGAIGWGFPSLERISEEAKASASVSHNHPEGIKGAQAIATAVWLAKNGRTVDEIRDHVKGTFGYKLDRTLDEIRPTYRFDESCQGTVPEALTAFFESTDFESAIRNAISLGGDADTLACITGAVAEAHYRDIPDYMIKVVDRVLDEPLMEVVRAFRAKYVLV
jgi:ADP-ribosylglycohydrolase